MTESNPLPPSTSPADSDARRTSPLTVAIAWAIVVIPAAWGVTQTIKTSRRLFAATHSAPTTSPAPTSSPTTMGR